MVNHHIMAAEGILVIEPLSAISADDFRGISVSADAYLAEHPTLHGLLIHTPGFPGWENFAGLAAHLKFVRDHHERIERVALVTDSPLGAIGPALARHFVSAQIKRFAYSELEEALIWLKEALPGSDGK